MNPFERWNINYLSPSALINYRADPGLWVRKKLLGWKDEAGPGAWRGNAVEAALQAYLHGQEGAHAKGLERFELDAQGDMSDDVQKHRDLIKPMLEQAILGVAGLPPRPASQLRVELRISGCDLPILGYIDFSWPDLDLDLKSTERAPSEIRDDHKFQLGIYRAAHKRPGRALYVTPKKWVAYDVTEEHAVEAEKEAVRIAKAMGIMLSIIPDRETAAKMFAPDTSDFRWNDNLRKLETALWAA